MIDLASVSSLPRFAEQVAAAFGDRPALKTAGSQDPVSYAELLDRARRAAGELSRMDISTGDRAVLMAPPGPDWIPALFGLWRAGVSVIPLPPDTPADALVTVLAAGQPRVIVGDESTVQVDPGAVPVVAPAALFAGEPHDAAASPDPALIAFTSGSTTRPRAVELTEQNLLADLKAFLAVRTTGEESRFLSMLPPSHLFELMVGHLAPMACGAAIVYSGALLPNRLIGFLQSERISHALAVPALVWALYHELMVELDASRLLLSGAETAEWFHENRGSAEVERLRAGVRERIGDAFQMLVVGGAAFNPNWVATAEALGVGFETGYGLTEASPVVTLGETTTSPFGSAGRALPGVELRVSADGEILVRGENVMRGYLGDPGLTEETIRDGWLHTGDCGEIDAEGHLYIRGRLKEAIVASNGETLYPEEVEPYYTSPVFREHCVVPVTAPDGNDRPVLCVVPSPELEEPSQVHEAFEDLRSQAPSAFRIEQIVVLHESLPRTASGKVRRRALGAALLQGEAAP